MKFQGSDNYVATQDLMLAVNAAITLKRPLLVKGEPGTGKTMLAEEVAQSLGLPLLQWHIKSTTKAQQGRRHARQRADAQPLDAPARRRRHRLRAGVERLEHAQRMRQQLLAGGREPLHAAPAGLAAVDQPCADDGLELGQRLRHRRLAQRQPLGRAREVPLLRHGDEAAQMAQLHVAQEVLAKIGGGFQCLLVIDNGAIFNLHHRTVLRESALPDSSHDRRQRSC